MSATISRSVSGSTSVSTSSVFVSRSSPSSNTGYNNLKTCKSGYGASTALTYSKPSSKPFNDNKKYVYPTPSSSTYDDDWDNAQVSTAPYQSGYILATETQTKTSATLSYVTMEVKTRTVAVNVPTITEYVADVVAVCSAGLITNTVMTTAPCDAGCTERPTGVPQGYATKEVYCSACATSSIVVVTYATTSSTAYVGSHFSAHHVLII
ncbi:hypothetical protein P153DRAFT_408841 [Dothidotthia symphoricarpi CBS 119687]|uniref:Uncharacterized protein n=1 Tax=Dothidotthia symphoricarpi CBS 119687 TaxID=1392245 RepID=A0A6A6A1N4_9PLEO|nr:uncharacterized protein P153DRAFT_408841 [Dothidotthia symphoricarpi CBS 119687]KAF2125912.1 hypothetical protein P153DRAFT_408841 [Dothidotthia symphoricarpi CBS 119687]